MAKARKQSVHLDKEDALVLYTESVPVDEETAAARREAQRQGRIAEVLAMGGSSKNQMQERLKTPSIESLETELTEASIEDAIAAIEDPFEQEVAKRVAALTGKATKTRAPRSSSAPRAPKVLSDTEMEAKRVREQKAAEAAAKRAQREAAKNAAFAQDVAKVSEQTQRQEAFLAPAREGSDVLMYFPQSSSVKRVSKSTRVASEGDILAKNGVVYKPHSEWKETHHLSTQEVIEIVEMAMQQLAENKVNAAAIGRAFNIHSAMVHAILKGKLRSKETGITSENPFGPSYQPKWLGEVVQCEADTVEGSDDIE